MEKQTIKLLGKRLQKELSLPSDVPFPIREALKSLVEAQSQQNLLRQSSDFQRQIEIPDRSLLECRSNDNSGGA